MDMRADLLTGLRGAKESNDRDLWERVRLGIAMVKLWVEMRRSCLVVISTV